MAFLPLSTTILLNLIDSKISRITNAYVESHMKTYENEILLGQKNLSIGWVIRALDKYNKYLIAKEEIYKICKAEKDMIKYPLYKDQAINVKVESEWAKNFKRNYGTTYQKVT